MILPHHDPIAFLKALIDIPSPTNGEGAASEAIAATLESLGFPVTRQDVSPGRFNVLARIGDPVVTLSTHVDCVPPHIAATEDATRVMGRGSCDAKGLIAAQIFAALKLRDASVSDFGLLFLVGEEEGGDGARRANETPGRNRVLINAEPTDFKQAVAGKGVMRLTLKTRGRAAHAAYPELGDSAIVPLLSVLADLQREMWPSDPVLGDTTMNIGTIRGGLKANIIPPSAESEVMFRTVTPFESIFAAVERVVAGRAEIEVGSSNEPIRCRTVPGFGRGDIVVRFGTDIPYLPAWGAPVLFGPGSIHDAHTDHEFILKSDLVEAIDVYASMVRTLLAS